MPDVTELAAAIRNAPDLAALLAAAGYDVREGLTVPAPGFDRRRPRYVRAIGVVLPLRDQDGSTA